MYLLFLPAAGLRSQGIDGVNSNVYLSTMNADTADKSKYVRITGSVFTPSWSYGRSSAYAVRLASVVSELTGMVVLSAQRKTEGIEGVRLTARAWAQLLSVP